MTHSSELDSIVKAVEWADEWAARNVWKVAFGCFEARRGPTRFRVLEKKSKRFVWPFENQGSSFLDKAVSGVGQPGREQEAGPAFQLLADETSRGAFR